MSHSSTTVCRLIGITYRQLDYWLRQGYIPCSKPSLGHGDPRRFSDEDVEAIKAYVASRAE